jgi:hypothetical protein
MGSDQDHPDNSHHQKMENAPNWQWLCWHTHKHKLIGQTCSWRYLKDSRFQVQHLTNTYWKSKRLKWRTQAERGRWIYLSQR